MSLPRVDESRVAHDQQTTPGSFSEAPRGPLQVDDLSFFVTVLLRHPEALLEISPNTMRRYASGTLPQVLKWLLRFPALLRELADRAEQQARQSAKLS
jgi:hypothetical protein